MKKFRGFKLGHKIVNVCKLIFRLRNRRKPTRHQLGGDGRRRRRRNYNPISRICSFARNLKRGAKELCFSRSGTGSIQLGEPKPVVEVPKGHLAVYVGESDDDAKRVLVPVIYFNHPLFGELLKEAERVYGFDHPGGITIPCGVSEFEKVQTRISAWEHCRRRKDRRYW